MGKKYDAYAKAVEAERQAANNYQTASGGSTERHMNEAYINFEQAKINTQDTHNQWSEDPEG